MNVRVSRQEFDKLIAVVFDFPCDDTHGNEDRRGPFLVSWNDANTVGTVQIVGTMIVICPE